MTWPEAFFGAACVIAAAWALPQLARIVFLGE